MPLLASTLLKTPKGLRSPLIYFVPPGYRVRGVLAVLACIWAFLVWLTCQFRLRTESEPEAIALSSSTGSSVSSASWPHIWFLAIDRLVGVWRYRVTRRLKVIGLVKNGYGGPVPPIRVSALYAGSRPLKDREPAKRAS
jgi:hypothetical protein